MKITKESDGNVYIYNSLGEIEHIITNPNPYLGAHPRVNTGILISEIASNQYESQAIKVYADKVTHVNSASFTGNRNALLILLSGLFPATVQTTSPENPDPDDEDNGGGINAPSDPGTGFRVKPEEEAEKTTSKASKSIQNTKTVATVSEAEKGTIWQQIQKFFSEIYKKITS